MGSRHWTIFLLCLSFLSWGAHICFAADIIYPAQSLTGKQTIVSQGGNFELGFFSPGNSPNCYIGIWYKRIAKQTVVWVANRDNPLSNISSSELRISEGGNLVLLDHSKSLVWTSNSTSSSSNSTVAVLLDSGNLVLRDRLNSSVITWQSFDHPTDTWLPGGWVGMNKITGEYQMLTSWKNSEDPSRGRYSESLDPSGYNQHVIMWNRTKIYWQSGGWNGEIFTLVPGMQERVLFNLTFVDSREKKYSTYTVGSKTLVTRNVMDSSGQVKQWVWVDSTQEWLLIWAQPVAQCDVHCVCGVNGVCSHKNMSCECLHGFEPASARDWQLGDWSGGCRRKANLHCSSTNGSAHDTNEGFLVLPNMRLPENPHQLKAQTVSECELACRNSCSCTAFTYGNGCSIWRGDLWNLQQLSDGGGDQGTLYLRVPASELPITNTKNRKVREIVIFSFAGAVILLCISLGLLWMWRRRRRLTGLLESMEGSLVQFTYSELQRVTKNFSEKIGRGGFGTVFKGTFRDSTAVAVKKLEGLRQGDKQFRNEVSTLGTIQHVNLVRLRGFCSQGSKRLLVYDYMPNGSLDRHLFAGDAPALNWRTRYSIVLGVARALAYLHEKCRDCIIHCDIKPENVLLDGDFNPKVADMGMAKLVGRDYSRVLTTMRGTFGYLAPEWISGLPITPKADVYSFGMTVFEVISGRRNSDHSAVAGETVGYFPIWAANRLLEADISCLLDGRLDGDADMEELRRACKAGCWCIQDDEVHRPSMGQVVQMLEGVLDVEVPPIPVSLKCLIDDQNGAGPSVTHHLADASPQWST